MSSYDRNPDPDDMFADTRMTFGEHLEDLRVHLIRGLVGFLVALFFSFFIGKYVLEFIAKPVEDQLAVYWDRYNQRRQTDILKEYQQGKLNNIPAIQTPIAIPRRDFRASMLNEFPELEKLADKKVGLDLLPPLERFLQDMQLADLVEWNAISSDYLVFKNARLPDPLSLSAVIQKYNQLVRPPTLTTLSVQEAFFVYFKVCLMTGFVLGSPWIFYQIWSFVAAGLYPHEKKYVNIFLPFSLGLFLAGVLVCQFFVMTKAVEALLWFNDWLGFAPDLRLNEWLGFAIFMPLTFGISFQTPLVMLFLQRVGVFSVDAFRGKRRISWFVMAVFAAVITPSVDPFSMLLLWVPMGLLYELGIGLCVFLPGRPLLDFEVPESEEMVEV
jgi:sec-independent protein translocase protein TatC